MRMQVWWFMGVLMTLAGVTSETSRALDLPVPCGRGQPGSTLQDWRFSSSANPSAPEVITNAYGGAEAAITVGLLGSGWLEQLAGFGTRTGYWDLGSNGTVTSSLAVRPGAALHVWVQVVQWYDGGLYQYASVSVPGAIYLGRQRQLVEAGAIGAWWLDLTMWRVEAASTPLSVLINGASNGSVIDQVTVDTWEVERVCPTNLVLDADAGQCSRSNVTWALPVADGCAVTNVICAPPPGSTFRVGTTPVTCVTADAMGNSASCSFNVAVEDPSAPPLLLSVRALSPTNTLLEIRWPVTCASNVLEQTSGVGEATNWAAVVGPIQRLGNTYTLTTNATDGARFYRLRQW